jgi:transposase-like protein
MGRKPRVDRSPEEKWQIVQEGIKSGNVSETCRRHGIAPNLFYRWLSHYVGFGYVPKTLLHVPSYAVESDGGNW